MGDIGSFLNSHCLIRVITVTALLGYFKFLQKINEKSGTNKQIPNPFSANSHKEVLHFIELTFYSIRILSCYIIIALQWPALEV